MLVVSMVGIRKSDPGWKISGVPIRTAQILMTEIRETTQPELGQPILKFSKDFINENDKKRHDS